MQKAPYYTTGLLLLAIFMLGACNRPTLQTLQGTEKIKKNGIAFRLQDYKQRIDYYEKNGMADKAEAERTRIAQQNQQIAGYFKQYFNFSPVYFFYASQGKALLNRQPVLLNERLEPDASIPLPAEVYVMGFGIDDIENHTYNLNAFRIEKTSIQIRPTFKTWLNNSPLQERDVQKLNRVLQKLNGTTAE